MHTSVFKHRIIAETQAVMMTSQSPEECRAPTARLPKYKEHLPRVERAFQSVENLGWPRRCLPLSEDSCQPLSPRRRLGF